MYALNEKNARLARVISCRIERGGNISGVSKAKTYRVVPIYRQKNKSRNRRNFPFTLALFSFILYQDTYQNRMLFYTLMGKFFHSLKSYG